MLPGLGVRLSSHGVNMLSTVSINFILSPIKHKMPFTLSPQLHMYRCMNNSLYMYIAIKYL